MSEQKKDKKDYITQGFFPAFSRVFQAGSVSTIKDRKEVTIKWDLYSATIYCFIYNRFNYHNKLYMSQSYIAANCNCSGSVVKDRVKDMEAIGILTIERTRGFGGTWNSNQFTEVLDITEGVLFKLGKSSFYQTYSKKLKDRKKRVEYLRGIVIDRSWTREQAINYYRNCNNELITGVYLQGDKLNSLLYLKDMKGKPVHDSENGFKPTDELRQYELNNLLEGLELKEDKDLSLEDCTIEQPESYNPEEIDGVPF